MTESAQKLLDLLHERRMLPDSLIGSLRKQVAAAPRPLEAHHIAKLLQQKGKITAYQARELLAAAEGRPIHISPQATPAETQQPTNDAPPSVPSPTLSDGDDDLGLALVEEDIPKTQRRESKLAAMAKPLAEPAKKHAAAAAGSATPPTAAPSLAGGVDDLLSDPLLTQSTATAYDPLGISKPARKKGWLAGVFGRGSAKHKPRSRGWESPLMLVGGGALLLLMIVGATLATVLLRSSGDELFKAAEADYSNGLYSQAIGKYEKFLRGRSEHPRASFARVRIGLARMRSTASGDAKTALRSAQSILPTLNNEPALAQTRAELAGLLPGIAEKFADAASKSRSIDEAKANVEQYLAAMQLVDEPLYLPTSVKVPLSAQLLGMQEKIDVAVREIEQDQRLQEAIANIDLFTKEQNFAKAYETHSELLKLYPRLRVNEKLQSAVSAMSAKLREQVRSVDASFAPLTEESPSPIVAEIALAKPAGGQIPELAKHLVPVVVDGVLYVLSATDGHLLWRRFVGREVETALLVGDPPDLVVGDARRQELLRLQGANGKLMWRLPLAEPSIVGPSDGEQLWLTLPSGQLLAIETASGRVKQQISFPQQLAAAASLSNDGKTIFQLGQHSNLYMVDVASLQCRGVHYVGHQAGEVQLSPQAVGPLVVVPQQSGLSRMLLHALIWNAEDASLRAAHPPVNFEGRLDLPLLVDRNRAIAINSSGAIRVLEVDDTNGDPLLAVVAEKPNANDPMAAHAVIADGLLVVGDERLAGYRVRNARGNLPPAWANHEGDQFVASLHLDGEYLFHARRQKEQAGVVIAATKLASQDMQVAGKPIWQTRIALEPAGAVNKNADRTATASCNSGDEFVIDPNATGLLALNAPRNMGHKPAAPLSARWRGGIIKAGEFSQLTFVPDNQNETPTAAATQVFPFQPTLRPGQQLAWLRPAKIDDQRFVAADRTGGVYLMHIDMAGAPHLAALLQTQLAVSLVAGPSVVGNYVQLIERGSDFDSIVSLDLADLKPLDPLALAGRVVWGPEACGDLSLLAIEPGGLIAVRAPASQVWICSLDGQRPSGSPFAVDDKLLIATEAGRLLIVSQEHGELLHEIQFAQPLASAPAIIDGRVAVRAADGAVLIAEAPR